MRDLYQEVTDKIIAKLEAGVTPWIKPWNCAAPNGGMPYNVISGKSYRGINIPLLYCNEYTFTGWLTYKQAQEVGAHVKAGEHGSMIVFFKPWKIRDVKAIAAGDKDAVEKTIPILRSFTVFNVAQVEGLPEKYLPKLDERTQIERQTQAEALLSKAVVKHGGDRAFFTPSHDFIQLPTPESFTDAGSYYATGLHELTHWTGHQSRLAREYGKRYGDEQYAREELVAEMGAAYLCGHCGIAGKLQHAEYIASWLQVLKNDKRAVLTAASHAQKAADFVTGWKAEAVADEAQAA